MLQKKYPNFMSIIDKISESSKQQVIEGLLQVYKFQHTIQIIRWLG
jgi:hypothetical protein